jgi:two-component system, LytTR family, sensor kinase
LQPLVENAIKFGLYDTLDDVEIIVRASNNNNLLEISVANPFDANTALPIKGAGFGLKSIKRRLELLFTRHDLLFTEQTNNTFVTTIKIPQL